MAERHTNNELFNRVREVWAGAPYGGLPEAAANHVSHRRYFRIDGPLANYTPGWNAQDVFASVTHPSAVVRDRSVTTTWVPPNFRGFDDEITTDSQLLLLQSYWLDRKLVTTLGLRFDQIETFGPGSVRDPVTRVWRRAGPNDAGPFSGVGTSNTWFESSDLEATRRSLGAVYHLNSNFSLTANFSNGIQIPDRNRTVLPVERVADPYEGDGRDYGVSFSFLENRISGAVKYYESKSLREGGQELVQSVFVNPNNDVMSSFDYYYRQAGLVNPGAGAPITSVDQLRTDYWSGADAYLFDQVSEGWEFETIANPTRNWTIRFNYSYTDRTRTNVLLEGEPWWAERVSLWQRLDTLYTQRTGRPSIMAQPLFNRNDAFVTNQTVADRVAESDRELAQTRLEEEQGYGNRKHKTNVWTRYSFTTGRLKGLAIAGGWRFQSKNIAGINLDTRGILWGNPRSLFDAMIQYKTKGLFGLYADRTTVTYQLNVFNVLNDRTFFITKKQVDTLTGTPYMMRGFREEPRNGAFTLRVNF